MQDHPSKTRWEAENVLVARVKVNRNQDPDLYQFLRPPGQAGKVLPAPAPDATPSQLPLKQEEQKQYTSSCDKKQEEDISPCDPLLFHGSPNLRSSHPVRCNFRSVGVTHKIRHPTSVAVRFRDFHRPHIPGLVPLHIPIIQQILIGSFPGKVLTSSSNRFCRLILSILCGLSESVRLLCTV